MAATAIKWNDIPDYQNWSLEKWAEWHQALVAHFAKYTRTVKNQSSLLNQGKNMKVNLYADNIVLAGLLRVMKYYPNSPVYLTKVNINSEAFKYFEAWLIPYGKYFSLKDYGGSFDSIKKHVLDPIGEMNLNLLQGAKWGLIGGGVLLITVIGLYGYSVITGRNRQQIVIQNKK